MSRDSINKKNIFGSSILLRIIHKERGESKLIACNDAQKFNRTREFAFRNDFDVYVVLAQGGKQHGLTFDFDAHTCSLGEAYRAYINCERYMRKAGYETVGIFTGGGFQLRVFTSPFNWNSKIQAYYEKMAHKFGADTQMAHGDKNLFRCPLTYNHRWGRWAILLRGGEKLREILNISTSKPNVEWAGVLRIAYGVDNMPPIPPQRNTMQEEASIVTKDFFLYVLQRENWETNRSGSLVRCPLSQKHRHGEVNHKSASLLTMQDGVVRILCHKKHKPRAFDIFGFYYFAFGIKYPEAKQRIAQLLKEYASIKEVTADE